MTSAENFFNQLAGDPAEKAALHDAVSEDIVKYAKSKGFDITADDVEQILSKNLGSTPTAKGTSIGWS